jgi:hypothetical protein
VPCLSCQPVVIFINNSKNILWNSFCFEIRSRDSFDTREHWVNCNVLTCQWMVPCRAKLVMNWYLLRPRQAQATIYIPPPVLFQWWIEVRSRKEVTETSSSWQPSSYKWIVLIKPQKKWLFVLLSIASFSYGAHRSWIYCTTGLLNTGMQ